MIVRPGAEAVVLAPLADWTAMEETTHLLSMAVNAGRLAEATAELGA